MRTIRSMLVPMLGAVLLGSAPAFAAPQGGHPAGPGHQVEEAAEGHDKPGGHEAPDHGEGGDHGGGHHAFTADDDHDGTANWADSDSDLFALDDVGFHAFNVALLAAVLFALTRRPIADTLKERALGIRKELTESGETRTAAQNRYSEIEGRLTALAAEVESMRAEARKQAQLDEEKMIERARHEAQRIAETAERNIRDEVTRAQHELRREAVELAVQLAEATLREQVTHDDRQRLAREFLESLNSEAANA